MKKLREIRTKIDAYIQTHKPAAFIMWLLVLPSSFLAAFVFHLSPLAVFICLKSDQILKCAVAAYKVNRYTWIKVISRDV